MIKYIPSLERFTKLKELWCDNNQLTSLPRLPNTLIAMYFGTNQLTSLPRLPNTLKILYCWHNLILSTIKGWNTFNKFKTTYYKLKFGPKLEKYFLNVMKKKKQQLNNELLYSPYLKFYKQFADPITLETMKN